MKLIVAEVVIEDPYDPHDPLPVMLKPEGTSWYPDARCYVRCISKPPRWIRRKYSVNKDHIPK